ncbi:hypothetical protein [Enterovirga aerilata]|uniref:Uncharacterized protein n=1 Tax=Enterovirga aerilata TaxID=2730920 RepID=A0A849IA14_9HYPH|nr:hypothetical protein [Enterovirga sp. DB1703]NNM72847.1 hypothetical protein [Enterovirga sp. DB1703]
MSGGEPEPEDWRARYGGLIGVVFAVFLALAAIWMLERMRSWATLGDCAFTRAPSCRALIRN